MFKATAVTCDILFISDDMELASVLAEVATEPRLAVMEAYALSSLRRDNIASLALYFFSYCLF